MATQFVCVRVQSMNGQNIGLFPFDGDLTWMSFFLNAHQQYYCRYGGREDDDAESHLSQRSLVLTMQKVLALHAEKKVQAARHEPDPEARAIPEEFPSVGPLLARRKENKCLHCHDVKQAELHAAVTSPKFDRQKVFSYPSPSRVGIRLNRDRQELVDAVVDASPAHRAGLQPGDRLQSVAGQRILTFADFSRVLERTPEKATLPIQFERAGETHAAALELAGPWRRSPDPSWRSSLHLAGPNPGFWAQPLSAEQKQGLGIGEKELALRVTFLFPKHPTPLASGLKIGDVLIELSGEKPDLNTRQMHAWFQLNREFGDRVPVVVLREGKRHNLDLALPAQRPNLE